jgi:nucleoside-diphosphate-sugar epimerase
VIGVRGDLADPGSLREAVEGVDAVSTSRRSSGPKTKTRSGGPTATGTRHLTQAVSAYAPQARVVVASTSNVYDADAIRPGREDDAVQPTAAYPASKLAAEALLRDSDLTWSILRLPFVYGDADGHLEMMPELAPRFGLHPAHTYSVAHHRDVAVAFRLALTGVMDRRIVNITDDAPVTLYEMAWYAGDPIEGSAEPLINPWAGRIDGSPARERGFKPTVATIHAAAREGLP